MVRVKLEKEEIRRDFEVDLDFRTAEGNGTLLYIEGTKTDQIKDDF